MYLEFKLKIVAAVGENTFNVLHLNLDSKVYRTNLNNDSVRYIQTKYLWRYVVGLVEFKSFWNVLSDFSIPCMFSQKY
jgi:hypothetical protein